MSDFTIIIPHSGPLMGLWATLISCENELEISDFDYNYVVVVNGPSEPLHGICDFLGRRLLRLECCSELMGPGQARQRGSQYADGKYLFFFDNHCLVYKNYFRFALEDFDRYPEIDELHSAVRFYSGGPIYYHYHLSLEKNFWIDVHTEAAQRVPLVNDRPYRVLAAGHGAFAVRRTVWDEVGGFWSASRAYGGDESYLELKMALLDRGNWVDPRIVHAHYMGPRTYSKLFTDDYYRQLMAVAYAIGGEVWAERVRASFYSSAQKDAGKDSLEVAEKYIDARFVEALEMGREHRCYLASIQKRSLDEVLAFCVENGIPC